MTREDAIYALDVVEHLESFSTIYNPGEPMNRTTVRELREACRIAVAALRAQQNHAKLGRSQWEVCPDCKRQWGVLDDRTSRFEIRRKKFCGSCGRPLTEEDWAELERRVNGETTD